MNEKQATLTAISQFINQALALADQIEDTYLGVLLDTALQHVKEADVTDGG